MATWEQAFYTTTEIALRTAIGSGTAIVALNAEDRAAVEHAFVARLAHTPRATCLRREADGFERGPAPAGVQQYLVRFALDRPDDFVQTSSRAQSVYNAWPFLSQHASRPGTTVCSMPSEFMEGHRLHMPPTEVPTHLLPSLEDAANIDEYAQQCETAASAYVRARGNRYANGRYRRAAAGGRSRRRLWHFW